MPDDCLRGSALPWRRIASATRRLPAPAKLRASAPRAKRSCGPARGDECVRGEAVARRPTARTTPRSPKDSSAGARRPRQSDYAACSGSEQFTSCPGSPCERLGRGRGSSCGGQACATRETRSLQPPRSVSALLPARSRATTHVAEDASRASTTATPACALSSCAVGRSPLLSRGGSGPRRELAGECFVANAITRRDVAGG